MPYRRLVRRTGRGLHLGLFLIVMAVLAGAGMPGFQDAVKASSEQRAAASVINALLQTADEPACPIGDASNPPSPDAPGSTGDCYYFIGSMNGCEYWWNGYSEQLIYCDPNRDRPDPCPVGDASNAINSGTIHCYYYTGPSDGCQYWWDGYGEVLVYCDPNRDRPDPCPVGDATNAIQSGTIQCYYFVGSNDGCNYWWDGYADTFIGCSDAPVAPCPEGDNSNAAGGQIQCYYAQGNDGCTYWWNGYKQNLVTCTNFTPPAGTTGGGATTPPTRLPDIVRIPYWASGCYFEWENGKYVATRCEVVGPPTFIQAGAREGGDTTDTPALPPPVAPAENQMFSGETIRNEIWIALFNLEQ
ncbi:MAG: hypothetical protein IT336_04410 [Thermomicrobiales bacterium]|nr:hypothetical protein [Thermomicrobiales bacterium]